MRYKQYTGDWYGDILGEWYGDLHSTCGKRYLLGLTALHNDTDEGASVQNIPFDCNWSENLSMAIVRQMITRLLKKISFIIFPNVACQMESLLVICLSNWIPNNKFCYLQLLYGNFIKLPMVRFFQWPLE